jgi:hypothetical protein
VQASYLASEIQVGRLNKKGDLFLDHEYATDMVIAAVADYVTQHFGGGMVITFPGKRIEVEVDVRPLCPCGCSASAHIGAIGCPCGLPDEPPCSPGEAS